MAQGAFVAHMWRDPNNPKTRLKTLGWLNLEPFFLFFFWGLIMGLDSGWGKDCSNCSSFVIFMISFNIASRNSTQKLQTS